MADSIKFRLLNSTVGETVSKTYQCRATITFETGDRIAAESVFKRLQGMEMTLENTLHDEALDLARSKMEKLHDQMEQKDRDHRGEVEALQQTISIQARELQKLKGLEDQLKDIT